MAVFRIGQRVRVVSTLWPEDERNARAIGHEGVVNEFGDWGDGLTIGVTMPFRCPLGGTVHDWVFRPQDLEPLVPPHQACDDAEFIASLDKLAQRVGEVA